MTRRSLAALSLLTLSICVFAAASPAGAVIPAGFNEVVLLGLERVHLKQDVEVISGSVVANDALPAGGDPELQVEKDVLTAAGYDLKGDDVQIKSGAVVGGDVHYNSLSNSGTVGGSLITPLALPVFGSLPPFSSGPSDGPAVSVAAGDTQALPAGTYGDVEVGSGATLVLTGGEYNFGNFRTHQGAHVEMAGPAEVRLAGNVVLDDGTVLGPTGGTAVGDIVFYVAGSEESHVKKESDVSASFFIANADLKVDKDSTLCGAFIARRITVDKNTTVKLDTYFFNRPPVAEDDGPFETPEDVPLTGIDVLANDSDPDGDVLTITQTFGASQGTSSIDDGGTPGDPTDDTLTYTPDPDTNGGDSFQYEICDDGTAPGPLCDTATVTVAVTPVNDPPIADDQAVSTDQETPVTIVLTGDDGDPEVTQVLTFAIDTPPSNGILTEFDPATGAVTYAPIADHTGADSFTFTVTDDATAGGPPLTSTPGTVSITVILTNDPPIVQPDRIRVEPGGTATTLFPSGSSLLGNDSDPDGNSLSVTTTPVSGPSAGDLTLNADGTFSYTNTNPAATSDQFVYEACDDGTPSLCGTATVFITIVQADMTVTVTKSGSGTGSVTSSPAGIDCGGICSAVFATATDLPISLPAIGDSGSVFAGWTGDADCLDGVLTSPADASCNAIFNVLPPPTGDPIDVTMALLGTGSGIVVSTPAGIDCPAGACEATFDFGTRVTFAATPDAGSTFGGFGGDGDCFDAELTGAFDVDCTATFNMLPDVLYTLTLDFEGDGEGSVTSSDFSIGCSADCSAQFEEGATVVLNARPDPGSSFGGYSGECGTVEGFRATLIMDADRTCTATFNGQ